MQALSAQVLPEKGVPFIHTFTPAEYQNKGKIWAIGSAPNGMIYMAADKGLLEYDGKTWKSYKGSEGFTRSLAVINDSLIYTGSDLDFGVWRRNKYNDFEYTSLYSFKEELSQYNEEFWHVYRLSGNILFVSAHNLYVYKDNRITKIAAPNRFTGSFSVNDSLFFTDKKKGLLVLSDLLLKPVCEFPEDAGFEMVGAYRHNNNTVFVTKNSGLYTIAGGKLTPVSNQLSQELKAAKVFSFEQINNTYPAFGTVLKGLLISNTDGKLIHNISKYKGLPNNTILSLHYSPAGKLWVGMDYGVSSLDINSNLTYFYDYRGDFGTGYTALLKNNTFYLGTNQGLYQSGWEDLNNNTSFYQFKLLPGSEGQVWSVMHIAGSVFVGHDHGLFLLSGSKLERLSNQSGVWTVMAYKDYLLAGSYNGISIFKKSGNKWVYYKQMELILGSCNQILLEKDNIIWVNIPNYGVIRSVLNDALYPVERKIFKKTDFEGSDLYMRYKNNQIQAVTDEYSYPYKPEVNQFGTETSIENSTPPASMVLPGIYQPLLLTPDVEFFPIHNGFALQFYGSRPAVKQVHDKLIFRGMTANRQGNEIPLHAGALVPYQYGSIKIDCIVPNKEGVLYQYKLRDDGSWSPWSANNTFELVNPKPGRYLLRARAMVMGNVTNTEAIAFRIATPFYRSWYAVAVYFLLFSVLARLAFLWQKRLLKKQEQQLLLKQQQSLREQAELHKQELMLLEQERLQAEYEQLKKQMKNKTIELTNKAKENEDKNRLLLTLKEKCEAARLNPAISKSVLNDMQKLLESYLTVEDRTFEIQMDELHQEFFMKLKEIFPNLSTNDLRLCAYLKIGLNSKEIAEILNILPSSVYISRSRLRKKLNVQSDDDLYHYLNNI
ncbi:hypothetical protein BVG80_18110 [Sphingobacteriales bacterium TSM_CSM]|nr:hypothetical protein BVG80_18110 [Sphingobacteriales bacterium TSM_CSM]